MALCLPHAAARLLLAWRVIRRPRDSRPADHGEGSTHAAERTQRSRQVRLIQCKPELEAVAYARGVTKDRLRSDMALTIADEAHGQPVLDRLKYCLAGQRRVQPGKLLTERDELLCPKISVRASVEPTNPNSDVRRYPVFVPVVRGVWMRAPDEFDEKVLARRSSKQECLSVCRRHTV